VRDIALDQKCGKVPNMRRSDAGADRQLEGDSPIEVQAWADRQSLVVDFNDPDCPYGVRVRFATWGLDSSPLVGEVVVVRRAFGPDITSKGLRSVKLARLLAAAADAGLTDDIPRTWERLRSSSKQDDLLREVADEYRRALDRGIRSPSKHVAEAFGYSRPHAARLVGLARQKGFLGPATPGKAGEIPMQEEGA
jgi:hypothetical protein